MQKWEGFQKGINLGGWLSQCVHTKEHYDSFIRKSDIQRIAESGADHVRLPVDYNLVQDKQGEFIPENFRYIDDCIEWCGEYRLNLVLDLHKTAGYSFDAGEKESGFFESEELIGRFLKLWERLAQKYGGYSDRVAFELLNEVVEERENEPWMRIAERAVKVIRKYASKTYILIGSYWNNSVLTVKYIAKPFDDHIVYNFHCYEPLIFTHQGASWVQGMPRDFRISYPVSKEEYEKASAIFGEGFHGTDWAVGDNGFDTGYYENLFRGAIEAAERNNVMLYCGEYGVIDLADAESRDRWYRDIETVLEKHGIGRAAWNYKKMNFGIFDDKPEEVAKEDLDAVLAMLEKFGNSEESRFKIVMSDQMEEGKSKKQYHLGRCDVGSPWAKGQAFDVLEDEAGKGNTCG